MGALQDVKKIFALRVASGPKIFFPLLRNAHVEACKAKPRHRGVPISLARYGGPNRPKEDKMNTMEDKLKNISERFLEISPLASRIEDTLIENAFLNEADKAALQDAMRGLQRRMEEIDAEYNSIMGMKTP